MSEKWICPDCGYDSMPDPPKDYNICPNCMVEFGNDDRESIRLEELYFAKQKQAIAASNLFNDL